MLDDLFTYRLEVDRYLTVTNAANHLADFAWFEAVAADFPEAHVSDRLEDWAMMAVQGPLAREIVQAGADSPLPARMTTATQRISGEEVLVCGTGYTGEDGVELLCAPEHAPRLWSDLVRRGAKPAGLGARDTLRLEVCFHLYGNELTVERGPIEAGLGWCCKEDTGFIGAEAVQGERARRAPPRSSWRSRSTARGSRGRATRSPAGARSRAGPSRRAWSGASAWPTCPPAERGRRHEARDRRARALAPGERSSTKPFVEKRA